MAMTVEKALLNNQSILQNFALAEEIDEQVAEIISGGSERFRIKNGTDKRISYTLDGVRSTIQPGQEHRIRTDLGGNIRFDRDTRDEEVIPIEYNLSDSQRYEFRPARRANRVNLYQIGRI